MIEDVHWAQPDALDMLRHVIRGSSGQLMVLATFRNDVDQGAALTHALGIGRLARPDLRIDLREMNSHEVAAVIDAVAPVERRRQWLNELDDLVTMSAGNPLRLREMLRQLELEPEIPISEITPETVRSLVDRRVRALDDTTRAALHAAAVLGQSFTLPILAEVSELDVHVTLAALERAADQGIVVEGPHVDDFAFAHPLFRNAIYYSLLRSRRARIHMRGAEVLAAEHERAGAPTRWPEIARHLVTARPASDAARTVHAARLAAEAAAQRYAHDEAVQWYGHALEGTRDAGWSRQETARLQLALGIQLEGSGELERARDQYFAAAEVARAERDLGLLCDAIRAATPQTTVLDHDYATKLGALADQALAELEPDDLRRARVIQTAAFARQYWAPELLPGYTADAARLARTSHDADVRHRALVVRYIGTYDEPIAARLELSRQIREHARREGLESDEAADARRLLNDLLQMGDTASFDAELEAFSQLGRSTSSPFVLYWSAALRATRRLTRSAANDAEGLINAAVTIGRRLQIADAEGVFLLQMFALRYQRGHVRESAHALATPRPEDPKVIAGTALLALIFAESGRPDAARSYLDRVVTPAGITLPHDNFFFGGVSLFAGVAAICGGARQRAALRAVLLEDASRFCLFGSGGAVFGTGHHWLARLALAESDLDGARRHLAEAARVCHHADAPFWAARARQESARIADAS